ncbi:carbohydrate-binding module family 50 protein, partial [Oidiodendron maius Zn]
CEDIESDYSLTVDQLTTWNTWLSSDCDTNLYANLNSSDTRAICVGVNASTPVGTSTSSLGTPTSRTTQYSLLTCAIVGSNCEDLVIGDAYCVQGPASSGTTTISLPAPTQSGLASNCDQYYTVASGDSCAGIETQFNVTFAQLYQWNPAIGSNYQSLWPGYGICVGVSS